MLGITDSLHPFISWSPSLPPYWQYPLQDFLMLSAILCTYLYYITCSVFILCKTEVRKYSPSLIIRSAILLFVTFLNARWFVCCYFYISH